jgi:hypothetical protein
MFWFICTVCVNSLSSLKNPSTPINIASIEAQLEQLNAEFEAQKQTSSLSYAVEAKINQILNSTALLQVGAPRLRALYRIQDPSDEAVTNGDLLSIDQDIDGSDVDTGFSVIDASDEGVSDVETGLSAIDSFVGQDE